MDYTGQQISPCYVRLTMCSRLHYPTGVLFMYQEPMCSTLQVCVRQCNKSVPKCVHAMATRHVVTMLNVRSKITTNETQAK